jgi:hypothetical protein
MANVAATFGFKHIGDSSGGSPTYQQSTRLIQSTNATKIGFGDPVQKANATSQYIVQGVGTSTPAAPIIGIFVGCQYTPSGGLGIPQWSPYWPGAAAADATAYIIDSPQALFLVATLQTAVVTSNIGNVVGFTTGTPQTVGGGYSIATIDQSLATTTTGGTTVSALPFKIVSLYQGIGNGSDPSTNFNWAVVQFNQQIWRSQAGW